MSLYTDPMLPDGVDLGIRVVFVLEVPKFDLVFGTHDWL